MKHTKLNTYGLSKYEADRMTESISLADYFESVVCSARLHRIKSRIEQWYESYAVNPKLWTKEEKDIVDGANQKILDKIAILKQGNNNGTRRMHKRNM